MKFTLHNIPEPLIRIPFIDRVNGRTRTREEDFEKGVVYENYTIEPRSLDEYWKVVPKKNDLVAQLDANDVPWVDIKSGCSSCSRRNPKIKYKVVKILEH